MSASRPAVRVPFNPLWVKSPVVLLRFPGLLLSLTAGAVLLALAASSYPMFISSSSSAALDRQLARATAFGAGMSLEKDSLLVPTFARYGEEVSPEDSIEEFRTREAAMAAETADLPVFDDVVSTYLGPPMNATSEERPRQVTLFRPIYRTNALDHIERVAGEEGDGVWIADLPARRLKIEPGDSLVITARGSEEAVEVPVDGIYKTLFNEPLTPYWRSWSGAIYPLGDSAPPPTFVIGDLERIAQISSDIRAEIVLQRFETPLDLSRPITLDDARAVKVKARAIEANMRDENSSLGKHFCFTCFGGPPRTNTLISSVVSQTERRIDPVEGPVRLLLVAGVIVALAVVAAAGAFAVATRRVEADLLFARGMNPTTMAIKTVAESVIPALLGAAAGYFAARFFVETLGPGGAVDENAISFAQRAALISVPVSIILLGIVSALAFLRRSESATERFGLLARIPWEVGILVLAFVFLGRLLSGGALVRNAATGITRPSGFLLLFPILFIAGFGMLAARLLQGVLKRVRNRSAGMPSGLYVAVHRLAGAPRLTMMLLAAAALALGIFVHAQTIVRSLETTVDAKALLYVGSDVQAAARPDLPIPEDFTAPRTLVSRFLEAGTVGPGGAEVDLLAVDPETLPEAAYWRSEFGAASIEDLMAELGNDDGAKIPVIVSAGDLSGITSYDYQETSVPVEVIAQTTTFPGTSSKRPMLVIDGAQLEDHFEQVGRPIDPTEDARATNEFWIRGDTDRIVDQIATWEDQPYSVLTANEVKDIPSISAVIDTFGVLNVLGLGAGLLVIVVILMYLQARQRARVVSYALSRRMGLDDASHRSALILELSVLLAAAYVVGTILALVSARIIVRMVDPLVEIPPPSLFTPPVVLILGAFVLLILVAAVGGAMTNARAKRSDFAEVMRLAD